jgi:cobalt-zinc-cadmium resistance protein CzcA
MINSLLKTALARPVLIMLLTLLLAAAGLWQAMKLPVDAVPDITNVQVQINTAAEGFSPQETEQRITYAIETAMAGLPRLEYTRSLSRYGLSQVTVVFTEGTDIYWARQQVAERLQNARNELPADIDPEMGPIVSGLGEIFSYTVKVVPDAKKADGSAYSPEDLRTIQDWVIRPQLLKVPGVTEINTIGGYVREYQVSPDLVKLLAFKLTLDDLAQALEQNNSNVGAGYIERNGEQWLIRSPGQLKSLEDISQLVIAKRDDGPVRVKDVAAVAIGKQLRTGAATQDAGRAKQPHRIAASSSPAG